MLSHDFWIGFGFFVFAIVAWIVTIPHHDSQRVPRWSKLIYGVFVPVVVVEIATARFSAWLGASHDMNPLEFWIGVNLAMAIVAFAIFARSRFQRNQRNLQW
jgi:hypothetical protein